MWRARTYRIWSIFILIDPSSFPSLMDTRSKSLFPSSYLKSHQSAKAYASWIRYEREKKKLCFMYRICGHLPEAWKWQQKQTMLLSERPLVAKSKKGEDPVEGFGEEPSAASEKKGTIAGAVALIVGTSIGSGILALPQKASPAGIVPSSICIILCWGFLLIEALLLVEVNVGLMMMMKKERTKDENELETISIRTMAQETLGDWGGNLATVAYIFLSYISMIAYSSKSGEILFHLIHLPKSFSCCCFTAIIALLISVGGTQATDQVNQWLTASMIGLLLAIEVLAGVFGGWSGLEEGGDWGQVPATIPVMIFALVYHDLAPVLCAYLDGDLPRLRASVILGSLVPMLGLLVWDAIALGLSAQADQAVDPVQLLMSVQWSGISYMVEAFSLLAVGTSAIGTLLGFSEFFKEQLKNRSRDSNSRLILEEQKELSVLEIWWGKNNIGFAAIMVAIAPTLLVSIAVPDAFSAATEIAGGYGMTILYGVLPPAMAWAMHSKEQDDYGEKAISGMRPTLLGVGMCACGVLAEQMYQDFSALHP